MDKNGNCRIECNNWDRVGKLKNVKAKQMKIQLNKYVRICEDDKSKYVFIAVLQGGGAAQR